ncbi:MAG TPA: GspH/FimT family pseudopilin [Thermoanaerobaculia bacterium]|nr:GspH/FimT family pseudopilin [Thermoanaerobaculia bacterium]
MKTRALRGPETGFTLIEALVVMVILLILMLIAAPPLFTMMRQGKLRGTAYETATLMRLARMDAIKHSGQGIVEFVAAAPDQMAMVRAFSDRNSNNVWEDGEPLIGRHELPNGVEGRSPADGDVVSGFARSGGRAVFRGNGAAADTGAIRFADLRENYLEVRVMSAAGRIEVRKCRTCASEDLDDWFAQGEGWTWEWK